MTPSVSRRGFLGLAVAQMGVIGLDIPAWAHAKDALTIGFPTDVPTWDPNARLLSAVQSLYKCVFDSPLGQAPDLSLRPGFVKAWRYRDAAALALELDLRDDSFFHNGDQVTAEDFRYTFFERPTTPVPAGTDPLGYSFIWRRVKDIEILSPTRVVMHFSEVMPTAVPWLHFLSSFIVPKRYIEKVGIEGFSSRPVGSGPYRLVEYERGGHILLEAFEKYWAGPPKIRRVTIQIIGDASTRVAAIDSRQVDLAVDLPIREIARVGAEPGLVGRVDSITDITLLEIRGIGPFEHREVRLAAHHAIDKPAISQALFAGKAVVIDVPAARGTPGYPPNFRFPYDPEKAIALLKQVGYGPDHPAQIGFDTTNGTFPNDYETARAIVAMWKKVGIDATLEVVEPAVFQQRLHANKLPEASLYVWGNAIGDPEIYGGYLFDPRALFAAFKSDDLGERVKRLLVEADEQKRFAGYRALHEYAVEIGATIPLFQAIKTVAYDAALAFVEYRNGWILPQDYSWKA